MLTVYVLGCSSQKPIRAEWTVSDRNQRTRVYELTAMGRKPLLAERSRWEQLAGAIGTILAHPGFLE
jgi:DNA-binding PadR family transcriptional regulator